MIAKEFIWSCSFDLNFNWIEIEIFDFILKIDFILWIEIFEFILSQDEGYLKMFMNNILWKNFPFKETFEPSMKRLRPLSKGLLANTQRDQRR